MKQVKQTSDVDPKDYDRALPERSVSVIIPVFNAAKRVSRAVESAIQLQGVTEVLLVEDGSTDGGLEVCQQILTDHASVRLLRHPDGLNHGAGASRNLGVSASTCEFVAFLDADDRYLANRFEIDLQVLLNDPTVDGVYNALANEYESEALREMWLSQRREELLTVSRPVPPDELIYVLFGEHETARGGFHTNAITVRRSTFDRIGGFDTRLRLQQDTHLWHRLAASSRLAAGNITEPVAIRVVHEGNRMTRMADHEPYFELWWQSLGESFREMEVSAAVMQAWRRAYAAFRADRPPKFEAIAALASWASRQPSEIAVEYGHFDLTLRRIFDGSRWIIRGLSAKNRMVRVLGGGPPHAKRPGASPDR